LGGALATLFAVEQQAAYAPELNRRSRVQAAHSP